ncbi:IS66-like element accessory protein TnpA [Roseibium sediminicola]|uniref:Transposase n=1 Tax=Roseibium sediminicola TaxID=2933272 RepID=A0ABT0H3J5_9HYPH|nr:transposase [Roseibium sp. CAU 1639]MCK7616248.1 transposase [Roseibium sp. CAU 1639]
MGRVEILTGRERRRIWSDDQKLTILEEVATSGLTIADVARRHDVLPQQIYAWRRKFAQDQREHLQEPCFLPVTLVASEAERHGQALEEESVRKPALKKAARMGRIEIRCKGGRVLKVDAGLDPLMLQGLIRSVEEA